MELKAKLPARRTIPHTGDTTDEQPQTPTQPTPQTQHAGVRQGLIFQLQTTGLICWGRSEHSSLPALKQWFIFLFFFPWTPLVPSAFLQQWGKAEGSEGGTFYRSTELGLADHTIRDCTVENEALQCTELISLCRLGDSLLWPNDSQNYSHTTTEQHGLYLRHTFTKSYTSAWIFSIYLYIHPKLKCFSIKGFLVETWGTRRGLGKFKSTRSDIN